MLYEPPKTKRYILIGAATVILAVLIVAIVPFFFRDKSSPNPIANLSPQAKLQQQKIQKEFEKLEAIRESSNAKSPSPEEIQKEFAELEKQRAESNSTPPTPEQIQAEFDKLEQMRK